MKNILFLIVTACLLSCSTTSSDYILTDGERTFCQNTGFDTTIISSIRLYNSDSFKIFVPEEPDMAVLNETEVKWHNGTPPILSGLTFNEVNSKSADLIENLNDEFHAKGYTIFMRENNFGLNDSKDKIAVVKTINKSEILKAVQTNGINWDIDNDSLISIIERFDKQLDLQFIGASYDWCEFRIKKTNVNWNTLADEVYEVCPDVVDQGTGAVDELAREMAQSKTLFFWWD
ncbi:MAG: hypothetical protein COA58_01180 [Bacteroidetes bacterium]|nr:MAG: hypothetical protein COA58_01180 [Bacteroidota bacterium]